MTAADGFSVTNNPFSARQIRPGAIPFRFPDGITLEDLLARLRQPGFRGQIIGPHGSGKSTLLVTLLSALEATGIPTHLVTLHDGQRHLPAELHSAHQLAAGTLVVVDGYEQLSFWSRFQLTRRCRSRHLGLLVTTHRDAGFPELFRTVRDVHLAQMIVDQLLAGDHSRISPETVAERFAAQQGNLREVLFDLYDLYERHLPR